MADRSKFIDEDEVAKLKKTIEDQSSLTGGNGRSNFLRIEEGVNKFRILPKRPEEQTYYQLRCVHWITTVDDNGDTRRSTVLSSKIHGDTKLDIFDEYINFARKELSDDVNSLEKITNWKTGILPQITYICYALKFEKQQQTDKELGLLEMKKSIKQALDDFINVDDPEDVISINPFTHVNDGKYILITYDSKAKKKDQKYKVKISNNTMPVLDEELDELEAQPTLTSLYKGVYTMEMFEKALDGLQYFDSENELDLFDTDEFKEIVAKVRAQYVNTGKNEKPSSNKKIKSHVDSDEEDEDEKAEAQNKTKSVLSKEASGKASKDPFEVMDRAELMEYIMENDLKISIKKSMPDDVVRSLIKKALAAETFGEENGDEKLPEEEESLGINTRAAQMVSKNSNPEKSISDIADLRKQLLNKKQ